MICLICPLSEYPKWQDGTIVTLFLTPFVIKDQRQSSMISLSWNIDTNWDFRLSFINCKVAQWIEIHHEEQKLMLICFEYISCQYPIHRNFCLNLERQKLKGKKTWYEENEINLILPDIPKADRNWIFKWIDFQSEFQSQSNQTLLCDTEVQKHRLAEAKISLR